MTSAKKSLDEAVVGRERRVRFGVRWRFRLQSCRSRIPSGSGADSGLSVDSALSALERNVLLEDSDEAASLTTLNSQASLHVATRT